MRKQVMISASNFKYIQITHTHTFIHCASILPFLHHGSCPHKDERTLHIWLFIVSPFLQVSWRFCIDCFLLFPHVGCIQLMTYDILFCFFRNGFVFGCKEWVTKLLSATPTSRKSPEVYLPQAPQAAESGWVSGGSHMFPLAYPKGMTTVSTVHSGFNWFHIWI